MRTFATDRFADVRCIFKRFVDRQSRRSVVTAALLTVAVLAAIAAVSGQQIPLVAFIPNGIFFPNPNGASQTYSSTGGGIS